jgi:hypothetical protein
MPDQDQQGQSSQPPQAETGGVKFRVTCPSHAVLGVADSFDAALKLAADHFHLSHASLVRDNLDNLEVEISEFKTVRVADAAKHEKPPEPDIVPGKLVTRTNV